MAVDVKVSIKGTWLFNEDFPQPSNVGAREVVDFFVTINGVVHQGSAFSYDGAHWVYTTDIGDVFAYTFGEGWNKDLGEDIRRVTFAEGEDVRESFVRWMNRSAKPEFATVAYKGEALATVFGKQTVTLKCKGMKMENDLEIRAAENGYAEGYDAGKKAEYDMFWDGYQQNGNRTSYAYAFYNWTDEAYNPKYTIDLKSGNGYAAFCWSQIVDTKVDINISNATQVGSFFSSCYHLETIRKLIVSEKVNIDGIFNTCPKLKNIVIEGVIGSNVGLPQSDLLTNESVQSIIDALKDFTGATGKTLTLHATVKANLTEAQRATITAKNWTLA